MNRHQKKGSGNSDTGSELISEEDELSKHRDTKVSESNFTLEEEIYQITDTCERQNEVPSKLHKVEIENPTT